MMKKRNEKFFNNNGKAGGKEKPRKTPAGNSQLFTIYPCFICRRMDKRSGGEMSTGF
jgi:hypothetical protein